MRHALLLVVLRIATSASAADVPGVDAALPPLIQKLGDDNFDAREAAEKAILALGYDREEAVAPVLKELLANEKDPEVRTRLDKLVKKMSALGAVDWSVEAGQIFQLPAICNKRVYIGNKDGTLICYDAATGKVIWTHENGGFIFKSVAVADGRVILIRTRKDGSPDGRIFALDALDGRELWSWQDEKKSQTFTAPIVADGAVYFGRENKLICLDALQGEKRWSIQTASLNTILAPPAVAEGRVVIGQYGGTLQCVNAADGKPLWECDLDGHVYAGASIDGGRVFTAGGYTVYRIDLKTGAKLWNSAGNDKVGVPLAVKGARIFVAHSQTLRCLNADDGKEIWSKETGGHIYAAPAAVGERVYLGSLNNRLTMYCLNAADGKELWTHCTLEGGYAEPIVAGRRLFIGYHSKFYCLKTGAAGPDSWPMSGGNPGRSGCNDER